MSKTIKVAVLGSTGYVGLELIKILLKHPNVIIQFLGCDNLTTENIDNINFYKNIKDIPKLDLNKNFEINDCEVLFLSLPHGISNEYVKKFFGKIKIIDLSADFRLDSPEVYFQNYNNEHSCSELFNNFIYGLPEIYKEKINLSSNISIPGCYPTSILTPLIPLLKTELINSNNIIIDSKSGYSGAGKKFNLSNIKNSNNLNFYNYNTNDHRHICEINQELNKFSKDPVIFSFNPHILPIFRGMMSTIYCDLKNGISIMDVKNTLDNFYKDMPFVEILNDNIKADFFRVQNTNKCIIKILKHHSDNKIILVSLIDNLIKGAAGQAIQCFNIISNFDQSLSLIDL